MTRHTFDSRAQFTRTSDAWTANATQAPANGFEEARAKYQRALVLGAWVRGAALVVAMLAAVVAVVLAVGG